MYGRVSLGWLALVCPCGGIHGPATGEVPSPLTTAWNTKNFLHVIIFLRFGLISGAHEVGSMGHPVCVLAVDGCQIGDIGRCMWVYGTDCTQVIHRHEAEGTCLVRVILSMVNFMTGRQLWRYSVKSSTTLQCMMAKVSSTHLPQYHGLPGRS